MPEQTLTEEEEKATRKVIAEIFGDRLSEQQIVSVINRMKKIIATGEPQDYAFVTATSRYKSNAETQAR
jgi:hypothetical protein